MKIYSTGPSSQDQASEFGTWNPAITDMSPQAKFAVLSTLANAKTVEVLTRNYEPFFLAGELWHCERDPKKDVLRQNMCVALEMINYSAEGEKLCHNALKESKIPLVVRVRKGEEWRTQIDETLIPTQAVMPSLNN